MNNNSRYQVWLSHDGRNRRAAGYILLSVIGFSSVPLIVSWSASGETPFLFNAGLRMGHAIGYLLVLVAFYRELISSPRVLSIIWRSLCTWKWAILLTIVAYFDLGLFALATRFIDVSITAILFETSTLFIILLMAWLFRRESRYRNITPMMLLMLALAFAGFAFAVSSQSGEIGDIIGTGLPMLLPGIAIAIIGALVSSLSVFGVRWGANLSQELPSEATGDRPLESLDLFGLIAANLVVESVATPLNAAIGIVAGEALSVSSLSLIAAYAGTILVLSTIAWRKSNLLTDNLGINAMHYAIPVVALVWLFTFSQVHVARVDYLVVGAAAIITANLLINFEAEIRSGFKALIAALWICGVFVYVRDDLADFLKVGDWTWTGRASYFEALALSATVFTLILSFRIARLVSRTADEENRTFILFRKLELLVERGVISEEILERMMEIDVSEQRAEDLKDAYTSVIGTLSTASASTGDDEEKRQLNDAIVNLNALVHSKQQGLVFGELAALSIFAAITVVIALFARPDVSGWTAFLMEMFATLSSSVIIFLMFNVNDLQRDRIARILRTKAEYGVYGVVFQDAEARTFERWISILVATALVATYSWLFWGKWVS